MKILICDGPDGSLTPLAQTLGSSPEISLVQLVRTGRQMVEALSETRIDLSVLAPEVLDLDRAIERSQRRSLVDSKVVATDAPSVPLIVKAYQYGINDVIPATFDAAPAIERLSRAAKGASSIDEHPVIQALQVKSGQLKKTIRHTDDTDINILQLLSVGMTDEEISVAISLNIQIVRNRIAHLIFINELLNRTQLAILQATNWVIPDFV
jgi:DNA-binding NarL/FixJ family response regulator